MATGATQSLREAFLEAVFRGGTFPTLPSNLYVSLHTGDPGNTGASEVSASDYGRLAIARTTSEWDLTDDGLGMTTVANALAITFPSPSSNWGTITHVGIWDAATGGNLLWSGALASPVELSAGDPGLEIPAGQLRLSLRGAG